MANLLYFNQIDKNDVSLVGGKGASLGELFRAGILVPPGFVITTEIYKSFYNQELPSNIQNKIIAAFDNLGAERVAVRSSAVAEDSSNASWAGQLESYLNVTRSELFNAIKNCWNSISNSSALAYAIKQGAKKDELMVAVIVQKMIDSEVSGVMFTTNPITKDKNEIMIEACFGLGELLVQGMVTPDSFTIDKKTFEIIQSRIADKKTMLTYQDGKTKQIDISSKGSDPTLSEDQIKELARLGIKIENHYKSPQDIEWALKSGRFYILQSRPITTI